MTSVIVYPYIVPNFDWLKTAALLWDSVHRISSEFSPADPPEVQELNSAIPDFLKSDEVTAELGGAALDVFEKWLRTHYDGLQRKGLVSETADWMTVYPDKFLDSSVELLCKYQVVRDPERPHWSDVSAEHLLGNARQYRLPKVIAVHYLSVIASILGQQEKADLFAEERDFAETAISSRSGVIGQIATTTLEAYLPEDVTIEKIVELRQRASVERLLYQTAIASIVDEVEKISSAGEIDRIARRAEDLAKKRIEETQRKYRQAKVGSVVKLLGVSLAPPGLATLIASALGLAVFAPAAVGAAICLAGAELLSNREKARTERDSTNWSYVFHVSGT